MKNSIKTQIIALIILLISLLTLLFSDFTHALRLSRQLTILISLSYIFVLIASIIYYIVFSKKKKIPVIVSIVALCCGGIVNAITIEPFVWKMFSRALSRGRIFFDPVSGLTPGWVFGTGIFTSTLIIFIALLIQMPIKTGYLPRKKTCSYEPKMNNGAYCSLVKHIMLLLFTFGIWFLIWIYRTTEYTNKVKDEEYRNPTAKLLLCMFVPFYQIYWIYKTTQRIDKMAELKGVQSDLSTLCLILAIFVPIIPPILIQDKMNAIVMAKPQNQAQQKREASTSPISTAEEIKNYKDLLDLGVITQEEFNAKKKQLLGL